MAFWLLYRVDQQQLNTDLALGTKSNLNFSSLTRLEEILFGLSSSHTFFFLSFFHFFLLSEN